MRTPPIKHALRGIKLFYARHTANEVIIYAKNALFASNRARRLSFMHQRLLSCDAIAHTKGRTPTTTNS